ncbi:MAG: preprotein translocase subunit SecY [Planctomycetes bacterium]|nr:preprotein translocase subunit SecY [Planctomycetota bacterium]
MAATTSTPSVSVLNLIRVPEVRKKILITCGILFIYRLGYFIPLPGLELSRIQEAAKQQGLKQTFFGMMSALTGSSVLQFDLFSLGVMPYISASIILSLLVKVVPALEQLSKEGQVGQKKINQYTRWLTIPICIFQAVFVYTGVIAKDYSNFHLLPDGPSLTHGALIVLALTAGSMFVMWLGEMIQEYGVGNGTSIIIMAGIVARLPQSFLDFFEMASDLGKAMSSVLEVIAMWIVVVLGIVFVTKGQRRIPIQNQKAVRGGRLMAGGQFLPFRLNQAGVMPIIFASALFLVPSFIGAALDLRGFKEMFEKSDGFIYITTFSALIFFFSYFWTFLMFQPADMATNLKEHGAIIPGIRPGKRTEEFLEGVVVRITLAGAAFLSIIAIIPGFVRSEFAYNSQVAQFLGGTSVLIVVGVALDLVDKLNAQLVMRDYAGFLKGRGFGDAGAGGWAKKV